MNINMIAKLIDEDDMSSDMGGIVLVKGYGTMTRAQAYNNTIVYLRQMAEQLEDGIEIPVHYFDMAKEHYKSAIS